LLRRADRRYTACSQDADIRAELDRLLNRIIDDFRREAGLNTRAPAS
jgi:hypothetical protein